VGDQDNKLPGIRIIRVKWFQFAYRKLLEKYENQKMILRFSEGKFKTGKERRK